MGERLSGTIERVTFHNPETGFSVLRVQVDGQRDLVAVVGRLPSAAPGEYVEAMGSWQKDRDHGLQFKADELRTMQPHTVEGIEKYLASGLVKGIGPHYARRIVEVFGERTLQVIDDSPSFLREVKGIGPARLNRIRESWREQQAVRRLVVFLQSHGIGTARAVRIHKTYGDKAIDLIRADPYRLATDVWGVGFKTADDLAARLNVSRDSPLRARAALLYVLKELSDQGHCGCPESAVVAQTTNLTSIDEDVIRTAVEHQRAAGVVVRDPDADPDGEPWLYLKPLFLSERGVAATLLRLREGDHPLTDLPVEVALDWAEKKMGLELAPLQRDAIRQATRSKVLVVTGGPGTGKTTIVRGILEIFAARNQRCVLCAPTGRAAKRLSETTGREAKTIHRLLEIDPAQHTFKRDRDHPLGADLVIVDETSMVDVVLMNQLLRAVPESACVVLVGDVDQLPSVGPGAVLGDVLGSKAVPVVRLTEIFRQAGQSWIVRAAHQVNHGELPESVPHPNGDFYFIEAETPETIVERIVTLLRERIPSRFGLDPLRDVQVLTPMNRSELGTHTLNARLQEVMNPKSPGPEVERFGTIFRRGDKVLQRVNDYQKEVFNGDVGRVDTIDTEERELTVAFEGRTVVYDFTELDELSLAYAMTIHKSQGSEYPAVVVPLHGQHYVMLQRNLLYTAITRGKRLVVLVGSRKALQMAVRRQDTSRRYTALRRRLQKDDETGEPGA